MAIVAEGVRGRIYLSPTREHETAAASAFPRWEPEGELFDKALGFRVPAYGLTSWADLFTSRQLASLSTFCDLVGEAREHALADALTAGLANDTKRLCVGGLGAASYADAVATYLGFATDRIVDRSSTICTWDTGAEGKSSTGSPGRSAAIRGTFSRQALQMTWDFAEVNLFSQSAANFLDALGWVLKPFDFGRIPARGAGAVYNLDAARNSYPQRPIVIATDPPYYDNIGYADFVVRELWL
jgi:putative DNA methylase